ncbi:glycosyltransferase family 2 protein [Kerstersia sp.]|uniref:glycosyltransferase family 2 protein n=1 Tax=Kerstersia sp. TaxID=1930783 RepID=UPI003F8FEAD6
MKLSICICTFRRPALLDILLGQLAKLDLEQAQTEVVVVDNDPAGAGLPVVQTWQSRFPVALRAIHQPKPNISAARNAAIHAALGEFVLFIDDDESPEPGWTAHMLATQSAYNADVVVGPVCPRFHEDTPAWVQHGGFFEPRAHQTGDTLAPYQGYSGNTLIRRALALQIPGPFDLNFGATGGEDVMFMTDMVARGALLVWCNEAAASEFVPPARTRLAWIVRRAYWGGQVFMRTQTYRRRGWERFRLQTVLGTRACLQGGVALIVALLLLPVSRIKSVRWLCTASSQAGKLSAVIGYHNREYGAL